MNKKNLIYLPALAVVAGITLSQVGVLGTFAEAPISGPITSPITGPIVTPVPTPTPDLGSNSGSGGSSDSGSGSSGGGTPAVCNDAKPGSAPKLLSAVSKKPNQVILSWSKATNPVTYYLVSYGINSAANQYGNPNIGSAETTSYTVSGLSGNTVYYFRVRAGNGCTPGDFSNVLSVKANGKSVSGPATGFKSGVLSAQTSPPEPTSLPPINTQTPPNSKGNSNDNVLKRIISFFGNLFNR